MSFESYDLRHAFTRYSLTRVDTSRIMLRLNDIVCCGVVRNERVRLPYFLRYYRRLGITKFFLVDNDSDDHTQGYLLAQPDVFLWHSKLSFRTANFGAAWFELLLRSYIRDNWCLLVDADEFFSFPDYETKSLSRLCQELDGYRVNAYPAILLDMYSDKPIKSTYYESDQDIFETCPYFDRVFYHRKYDTARPYFNQPLYVGGARERVFGPTTDYFYLSKVPLLRFNSTCSLAGGQHWTNFPVEKVYRGRGCLHHFKFISSFCDSVRLESLREEHAGQAKEYKQYHMRISQAPLLCLYDPRYSVRYENSLQLLRLGIIEA